MRALHIITGLGVGGAEQQLRLLLRHLPVDCDVVTLTNPGPVAEGLRADGVRVLHLGMAGNRDVGVLPRLVRVIRSGRYDLVHTHLYRACVYGPAGRADGWGVRAVVATEHSLGDSQMEGRALTQGVRALYLASERLGSATVAVSPTVADRLKRWGCPLPGSRWCRTASSWTASASIRSGGSAPAGGSACRTARSSSAGWAGSPPASGSTSWCGRWRGSRRTAGCCWWAADPRSTCCAAPPTRPGCPGGCCSPGSGPPCPTAPRPRPALAHLGDGPVRLPVHGGGVRAGGGRGAGRRAARAARILPGDRGPAAGRLRRRAPGARWPGGVRPGDRRGPRGGPGPRTAAEAARHYSITRSSARLMDVYAAAVAGRPSPSLHVKEAPSS